MKKIISIIVCVFLSGLSIFAEESTIKGKIVSVGLFKNGLAFVEEVITLDGPGVYQLETIPQPIHGTFWFDHGEDVEFITTTRTVEQPTYAPGTMNLSRDLSGHEVTVYFKDTTIPAMSGIAVKYEPSINQPSTLVSSYAVPSPNASLNNSHLILETENGLSYIAQDTIAHLQVKRTETMRQIKQPVLLIKPSDTVKPGTKIRVSYLTRGFSWAPSYKLDITDPDKCTLVQKAVIRNELTDIEKAELSLISGFPNVEFEQVSSPMSPGTTWSNFFTQLTNMNNRGAFRGHVLGNNAMSQIVSNSWDANVFTANGAIAIKDEQSDLSYHSIGKRTMGLNDVLTMQVGTGTSAYQRIVEWEIPNYRDEYGRNQNNNAAVEKQGVPWDVIQFKNPMKYPMTTGPMMVMSHGRVFGQSTSHWVNPGEEAHIKITKALSIPSNHVEHEKDRAREPQTLWGSRYYKTTIEGEIRVTNTRSKDIDMRITRVVTGEVLESTDTPKIELLSDGAWSVNKRSKLNWKLPLKSGESKVIKYSYVVYIRS